MAKKKRKERGVDLNQTGISDYFGIDPRQIRRLMDEGAPHKSGGKQGREQIFNSQQFFDWFVDREIRKRFGKAEEYRERYHKAQAEEKEINVQLLKGRIVELDLLEDYLFPLFHNIRAKILSLPHALAHRVATLKEVPEIEAALEEKIHEALSELSYERPSIVNKQISRRTGRDTKTPAKVEGERMGG